MTAISAEGTVASKFLADIGPLVGAGLALHYLHPRSKRPIGEGWQNAAAPTLAELQASFTPGNNLGVRLGEPSPVAGGWLHAIDVDVRIAAAIDEVLQALRELLPIDANTLPSVRSGSGGHSFHIYFVCDKPLYGRKLWVSEGKHRASDGRWRYDAEIELMGTGRQIVLPPSIHPDTLKPYRWVRPLDLEGAELGLQIAPTITADQLEAVADAVNETFDYETIEPLTFKPGQLEAELNEIPDSRIDDYHDWVALGMALHHQFGASDRGFGLWVQHSKRSEKFTSERDMRGKWRGFGRSRRAPVTMASVRLWVLEARRERTLSEFDEVDGSFDEAPAAPVVAPDLDDDDLLGGDAQSAADDIDNAGTETRRSDWKSNLDFNQDGAIKPTLHNLGLIVKHDPRCQGILAFNELSHGIVFRQPAKTAEQPGRRSAKPAMQLSPTLWTVSDTVNGEPWGDAHHHDLRRVVEAPKTQGGYGIKVTDRDLLAAVLLDARERAFHPIREYLGGLAWDGTPRCESLFVDYLGADDNAYTRSIARLMLVAAVARVFEYGTKFDFVVILEGGQGIGKSTFIRTLGKHWYAELEGDFGDSKQMLERMMGKWILEIPELAGFYKTDVRKLKGFVSRQEDRARLSYDRYLSTLKRQCVMIGSTNENQYLVDNTGNRRWWPVKCSTKPIDTKRLAVEIDQVWAEAVRIFRQMRADQPAGSLPLYLSDADVAVIAADVQESRRMESVEEGWAGQIERFLQSPVTSGGFDQDEGRPRYVTCLEELWQECFGHDQKRLDRETKLLSKSLRMVPGWGSPGPQQHRFARYGQQRAYWREGYEAELTRLESRPALRVVGEE